jgi:iron(III) transport system permease protein
MITGRGLVFAAAMGMLAAICVAPLIVLLAAPAWVGRWDAYRDAILDVRQIGLLLNSLRIAGSVAVVATALGACMGFLLARAPIRARNAVRLGLTVPLLIPSYALALSWIFATSAEGFVTRLMGLNAAAVVTYSPVGTIIVLAIALYPIPMLATEAAVRRIESRLEEAALLVAQAPRVLARITLPLLWPAIASSALLTFVLALSDYAVPNLLRQRVFTTEVFTAFAALYDSARAAALAVPLLAAALVVGYVVAARSASVLDVSRVSSTIGIGFAGIRPFALAAVVCLIGLGAALPVGTLAAEARTLGSIREAIDRSGGAIGESVALAGIAATVAAGVALVLGYRRARSTRRWAYWVDAALIALFAVPGTLIGVGLIELWNRPGIGGAVYGTAAIVVIAYLARFMPVAILILSAGVRRVSRSAEEAAALSGAGWVRSMRHIVLPQIAGSLLVAWVMVFVLAFGEVGASVLVAPAGHTPYPVHVLTLIANTRPEQVAALALVQTLVVVGALSVASAYLAWSSHRHE